MTELSPQMQQIKNRMRETWAAGDFVIMAEQLGEEGEKFISRLNIKPGIKLLDVACGAGTLSIPAAKAGAEVTGLDLVPNAVDQAGKRALEEGLKIRFDVGDAEDMPYSDNEFDCVVSMFGAMFAPRPDVTVNELLRVCRPGGTIAMANWTPRGFGGQLSALNATYAPFPSGLDSPVLWANESVVSERFGNRISMLKCTPKTFNQYFPFPPEDTAEHYITYFGPARKLYNSQDENKGKVYKNDLIKLLTHHNISLDGTTVIKGEYLEVIAVKAQDDS